MREFFDTEKRFCSILFDIISEKGVRDVVCSPGSRNAPLLIAAATRPELKKRVVVDERSAGFIALGMAIVSKRPVALVCTSGTALLNYAPAVAEAYYQGIPLIVISADRPIQWIDQDDSQTLHQTEALNNYVKGSYSIPAIGDEEPQLQWYANRIVNDALIVAESGKPGPVHINISLDEPLGGKRKRIGNNERIINLIKADTIGNKEKLHELALKLSGWKVLLVAGFMQPDSDLQKAISLFSRLPNVAVMAETISNLHLDCHSSAIDSVLTAYPASDLDAHIPDLVISIGGALVSRKLKEYLRRNSSKIEHWSVGFQPTTVDCFMSLTLRVEVEPARFFRNISRLILKSGVSDEAASYKSIWNELRKDAEGIKERFITDSPWSEIKAFSIILNSLKSSSNLFLSNGTAIRYAQIIDYNLPHASYCNRGVSGIDGSVSTAVGGSLSYPGDTLLITGDLSMAYDIGVLGVRDIPDRFKIIVIDNQGGGIFRFIASTSQLEEREEYFCTSPLLPLRHLAEAYGFDYFEADDEESLRLNLQKLKVSSRKAILRVVCDGRLSAEILKNYMDCKV